MEECKFKQIDIEFHKRTADQYDNTIVKEYCIYHQYLLQPWIDKIYAINKSMKVLDVGCGTGVVSLMLAQKGFNVVGIDHSQEMLEISRRKALSLTLQGTVEFIEGDVEQLEFESGTFDVVTCQGVLHHIEDMGQGLSEMYRVLKHGGYFYISEPCDHNSFVKKSFMVLQNILRLLKKPRNQNTVESQESPISPQKLFYILDDLGFKYEYKFLIHLPVIHKFLPDFVRLSLTKILSFPWRNSKGDLIFLFGRKV